MSVTNVAPKGCIFEVKRFAVHDGDGIRTTVFFSGCPLHCVWCHNPEGIPFAPQLGYYAHKCIGCGACSVACPTGAHTAEQGVHRFERAKCTACGACEKTCPQGALALYGKEWSAEALLPILLEDRSFYATSGGGVTLSGGECLCQAEFCAALLKELKWEGVHTAVDTCGFVSRTAIDLVLPYTDLFLYDLKAFDEQTHIRCTGHSNRQILENLRYIDAQNKRIEIRIPFVPDYNDTEIPSLAEFLSTLKNVSLVRVLPYHNYAGSKYAALDVENTLPARLPTEAELAAARDALAARGIKAE